MSPRSSATLLHNITHFITIIIIIITIIITHKSIWRPSTFITLSVPLYQVKVTMGTAKEPIPDMKVITILFIEQDDEELTPPYPSGHCAPFPNTPNIYRVLCDPQRI